MEVVGTVFPPLVLFTATGAAINKQKSPHVRYMYVFIHYSHLVELFILERLEALYTTVEEIEYAKL